MKNRVALFVICFCINNFSQTVVLPQFSELRKMGEKERNAHLFYRVYSYNEDYLSYTTLIIFRFCKKELVTLVNEKIAERIGIGFSINDLH